MKMLTSACIEIVIGCCNHPFSPDWLYSGCIQSLLNTKMLSLYHLILSVGAQTKHEPECFLRSVVIRHYINGAEVICKLANNVHCVFRCGTYLCVLTSNLFQIVLGTQLFPLFSFRFSRF